MAYLPVVLGLIVLGAGVVKGFTGFGGSLIMAPLFSLVMSPSQTLGTVVVVNLATAWQMLGPSWRAMRGRVVLPMSAACALATPLGVAAVLMLDPTLVRRTIGVAVLVSGLALLGGWQRVKPPRLLGTIAVGVVGGLLTGLSGMGGPPAALWLLSGRDGAARDRA
ncbi:MAG: sulfite exporter TauE/SafE family protein, partial [Rhodopila sp.]|nr:sulfite exporter TauE/SafE family protein [Rhodopila sp.]